jgi:hypothetical protein
MPTESGAKRNPPGNMEAFVVQIADRTRVNCKSQSALLKCMHV